VLAGREWLRSLEQRVASAFPRHHVTLTHLAVLTLPPFVIVPLGGVDLV
jgi:hypothetical protein